VGRWLLLLLDSPRRLAGTAQLAAAGEHPWPFNSAAELLGPLEDARELTICLAGASPESPAAADLRLHWPHGHPQIAYAEHAAYLLGMPAPDSIEGLQTLAAELETWLHELPDDVLAQLDELILEAGVQAALGIFTAQLHQRHDPLSQPHAGHVNLDPLYPHQHPAGSATRQSVPQDILERTFAAREALAGAFTEYEERPQQIRMATEVDKALAESRPLIIEAGTGVGKSLAYLLPLAAHAVRSGKLCLISTNTINLQQQLLEQDVPRMRRILDMLDVKVTLLKGREHYLCLKRLQDTWLAAGPQARSHRERMLALGVPGVLLLARLLREFLREPNQDLDGIPSPPNLSMPERMQLMGSLDCRFATCLGERCPQRRQCHFFARRDEAESSHLTITNHALVFALHGTGDGEGEHLVSKASVIVFDEAHNLESAITNQMTATVSHEQPVNFANWLQNVLEHEACGRRLALSPTAVPEVCREQFARVQQLCGQVGEWVRAGVEIREQVNRLLLQASQKGHLPIAESTQLTPSTATPGQAQVMQLLAKLAQRLLAVLALYRELAWLLHALFCAEESELYIDDAQFQMDVQALAFELEAACRGLEMWRPEDPLSITWFNCDAGGGEPRWEYNTAPLDPGPYFQSLLAAKDSVILSSATLAVADSFDYLQRSLGFDAEGVARAQWVQLDSPFDYAKQALLLVATDLAGPTGASRDEYLEQLEEVVCGVCQTFKQGILVLFNSYRDLNHIADRLALRIGEARLLVQGVSGTREEIAIDFRDSGNKVLLATRSFWEGFDVAGEALSCVVLAKLPFANFKDPIIAGRQRAIEARGESSFYKLSLPLAAMQLKQGFGRLIRSTRDFGCVFLLDSRVATMTYGRVFLNSLPGPRTFMGHYHDCLAEAEHFMSEHQAAATVAKRARRAAKGAAHE